MELNGNRQVVFLTMRTRRKTFGTQLVSLGQGEGEAEPDRVWIRDEEKLLFGLHVTSFLKHHDRLFSEVVSLFCLTPCY